MKNKEWIRGMTDAELAEVVTGLVDFDGYCRGLPECYGDLDAFRDIPPERCRGCAMLWLEEEYAESEKQ